MDKHTVSELKDMCRARGLKVTGNKKELIARLQEAGSSDGNSSSSSSSSSSQHGPAKKARTSTAKLTARNIGPALEAVGMKGYSYCAASAITKGYLRWNRTKEELDQPAVRGDGTFLKVTSSECDHTWKPTLRSLLEQPDYAGLDYEDGCQDATVRCPEEGCGDRMYLTNMCTGEFRPDSGKSHNHCTDCKGLGKCLGDYRMAHCDTCNKHYFAGLSGQPCDRCSGGGDDDYY